MGILVSLTGWERNLLEKSINQLVIHVDPSTGLGDDKCWSLMT